MMIDFALEEQGAAIGTRPRAGAELCVPLGISLVGGLLISQALSLSTTPVVYLAFDSLTGRRTPGGKIDVASNTM